MQANRLWDDARSLRERGLTSRAAKATAERNQSAITVFPQLPSLMMAFLPRPRFFFCKTLPRKLSGLKGLYIYVYVHATTSSFFPEDRKLCDEAVAKAEGSRYDLARREFLKLGSARNWFQGKALTSTDCFLFGFPTDVASKTFFGY